MLRAGASRDTMLCALKTHKVVWRASAMVTRTLVQRLAATPHVSFTPTSTQVSCVVPRLHDRANIEQTLNRPDGTPPLAQL